MSAADALVEIKAKGYHEKWLRCGKKVTLAGVAFDAEMRNHSEIVTYVVEVCSRRGYNWFEIA